MVYLTTAKAFLVVQVQYGQLPFKFKGPGKPFISFLISFLGKGSFLCVENVYFLYYNCYLIIFFTQQFQLKFYQYRSQTILQRMQFSITLLVYFPQPAHKIKQENLETFQRPLLYCYYRYTVKHVSLSLAQNQFQFHGK